MASIIPVENETTGTSNRMTKGGRRITYEMNVVQQPERARACGQGAKSSTDRRPVDPPPIVDLRVFEGEDGNKRDITAAWNANFFLYASLEQARPIAQGRVPQSASNAPVLTGTPVAGMSYLDRPSPAGYFIFPDLSIRHEGKYRLSFQLYEETRDSEDKDPVESTTTDGTGELYVGRCQVKSVPFTVYSAKKFPGLAESTHLSRMVADQGCRVRIRRDVRMRRRDQKDSKDWDEYDEKPPTDLRGSPTPEPQAQAVAISPDGAQNESMDSSRSSANNGYRAHSDRRNSSQDMGPQYQQYQAYPQQQQQQAAPQPPPAYAAPPAQYESSPMGSYHSQYAQQQMVQSPQTMQPPQQYSYGYPQQPMVQYPQGYYMPYPQQQQPQHQGQSQPHQPQQPIYDQPMGHVMNYGPPPPPPQTYSNQSIPAPPVQYAQHQQSQISAPLGPMGPGYGRMPPSPYTGPTTATPAQPGKDLPPLRGLGSYPGKSEPQSPTVAVPSDRSVAYPGYSEAPVVPLPTQYVTAGPTVGKRNFGTVFSTQPHDQRLQAGARPVTANGSHDVMMSSTYDEGSDEDALDFEALKMIYRRADGTQVSRRWPPMRA